VGYCTARNGDTLTFAYLLNGLANSTYGHTVEANMAVALANYRG
jgi:D-alanyl-D-alanine carboxypeptidase